MEAGRWCSLPTCCTNVLCSWLTAVGVEFIAVIHGAALIQYLTSMHAWSMLYRNGINVLAVIHRASCDDVSHKCAAIEGYSFDVLVQATVYGPIQASKRP